MDPIPITYTKLFPQLFENHLVVPIVLKLLTLSFLKWYDPNAHYKYHARILSHSTEDYTPFKYKVQGLIRSGALNFDEHGIFGLSLPNHMGN